MSSIDKYTKDEVLSIKSACSVSARILDEITEHVRAGKSTDYLDEICHHLTIKENAESAYLSLKGYPKNIFTSINSAVRGVPTAQDILKEGDIINVDISIYFDGFYGSSSRMYYVGKRVPKFAKDLCERAYDSLELAINTIHPGQEVDTIIDTINKCVDRYGYSLTSHGIKNIRVDDDDILKFNHNLNGILEEGMIFTLSPIINLGSKETLTLKDSWSIVTKDKKLTAHFSHCVGITKDGCEIFTLSPSRFNCPPYN